MSGLQQGSGARGRDSLANGAACTVLEIAVCVCVVSFFLSFLFFFLGGGGGGGGEVFFGQENKN